MKSATQRLNLFIRSGFAGKLALLLFCSLVPSTILLSHEGWTPPQQTLAADEITTDKARQLNSPLWIDARTASFYQDGHVPGAIRLTVKEWDALVENFFATYSPNKPVVVYCSPDCDAAEQVARKLRELGIEQVYVLAGGYEAWQRR